MTDANHEFLASHDHLRDLGIELEAQDEGRVRATLAHPARLTSPGPDSTRGGGGAPLPDPAAGAAPRTPLEDPPSTPHASTDLTVSSLRPADDDLTAEATVLRVGGSMGVVRVAVTAGKGADERVVAEGRVTLHISRG